MEANRVPAGRPALCEALRQMESALELLDRAAAPAQIGARLDFAICELRELIGTDCRSEPVRGRTD